MGLSLEDTIQPITLFHQRPNSRDFLDGPVVKWLTLPVQGICLRPLVRELGSRMPWKQKKSLYTKDLKGF